ncbi:hypothetical protein CC99x_008500 [Candidatus Berkiella cookevillensis]|uniref:Uncharacterized protein n=1 Tax=Candidatus Berkiella cookevillensis TaxID=437022 RepID=A0A0Q9YFK9_9GAMM|nr:hypothetical protein [Candidatus Berkiella cookevillensis]MCS5708939.1 hypothetical protein [Candidatus Berkiella cookevillensis]
MASYGPSKKFLIVADLDYTHFNSNKAEATWMGSEGFWLDLYKRIFHGAQSQGIEMLFAVVTNKPNFDDICEVAAIAFAPFLQANTSSGPFMYPTTGDKGYCLTRVAGNLQYECLEANEQVEVLNKALVPHFIIEALAPKSKHIIDLATRYNIALENCLMLDDTPEVLEDVSSKGISRVGFECFNPGILQDMAMLDDPNYLRSRLNHKREEIFKKVQGIIERITRQHEESLKMATPIPVPSYTPLLSSFVASSSVTSALDCSQTSCDTDGVLPINYERDPEGCLHSWDARERLFGRAFKN